MARFIEQLILRFRLASLARAQRRVSALKAALRLNETFPHGRFRFGRVEVLRFDAAGGYDTARYLKEHPEVEADLKTPAYLKPRVERSRVDFVKS